MKPKFNIGDKVVAGMNRICEIIGCNTFSNDEYKYIMYAMKSMDDGHILVNKEESLEEYIDLSHVPDRRLEIELMERGYVTMRKDYYDHLLREHQ